MCFGSYQSRERAFEPPKQRFHARNTPAGAVSHPPPRPTGRLRDRSLLDELGLGERGLEAIETVDPLGDQPKLQFLDELQVE